MDIEGKRVMVFGAWGLVGRAICRQLLEENPSHLIVTSLRKEEVDEIIEVLRRDYPDTKTEFSGFHGNLFVREELKDKTRNELVQDRASRRKLLDDIIYELSDETLRESCIYKLCDTHRPDVIFDCINTATALAYQDVYFNMKEVERTLSDLTKLTKEEIVPIIETHFANDYIPQLVRHMQIIYESMRSVETQMYIKIGTSGSGGMGLNIPYTHSEEKPSRVLLSKSALAGAHTLLLFLLARTPDAPITKEIKPTAAVAWKSISYGPVQAGGRSFELYDCPRHTSIHVGNTLRLKDAGAGEKLLDSYGNPRLLESVYIDTGENGLFSRCEFETITSIGQMEYVTPEEIARYAVFEMKGRSTGLDVVNAMNNAAMDPTYRAGAIRHRALEKMKSLEEEHGVDSIAFEMLGPPRLSKLLYESYLLRRVFGTMSEVVKTDAGRLSEATEKLVMSDQNLRSNIISIGIPILMRDGESFLRGPVIKIPPFAGQNELDVTAERLELWAEAGWVDLRVKNMEKWRNRLSSILEEIEKIPEYESSSKYERDRDYWLRDEMIDPGKVVSWIFINEEKGRRMID